MQQGSEYDLMTNSMEFTQQTTSPLLLGDNNVCNWHLMRSTYLRDSPKVKATAENGNFWYKHKLADVYAICCCKLHQWPSVASHVTCQSSTASVRWHHKSSSEHCCIVFQIL